MQFHNSYARSACTSRFEAGNWEVVSPPPHLLALKGAPSHEVSLMSLAENAKGFYNIIFLCVLRYRTKPLIVHYVPLSSL